MWNHYFDSQVPATMLTSTMCTWWDTVPVINHTSCSNLSSNTAWSLYLHNYITITDSHRIFIVIFNKLFPLHLAYTSEWIVTIKFTSSFKVTLVPPNSGSKTLSPSFTLGEIKSPFWNNKAFIRKSWITDRNEDFLKKYLCARKWSFKVVM